MAEETKQKTPYVPWTTFLNFLTDTSDADADLPPVVDRSILSNYSGSVQSILTIALKATGMIDDLDAPTQRFVEFAATNIDSERKKILRQSLQEAFPYLFDGTFSLKNATPALFDEQLRTKGGVSGSTLDKAANFFMAGAEYTGVEIGPYLKKRKPSAKRVSRRTIKKIGNRKSAVEDAETGGNYPEDVRGEADKNAHADLNLHPFIEGLLKTLPREGSTWSHRQRAKWLTLAANAFDMIYDADADTDDLTITVSTND